MTIDQIKPGQRVVQTAHPEYGVWFIKDYYSDGMWNVHKSHRPSDGICICEGELARFWEITN